jgi:hypothetical protein
MGRPKQEKITVRWIDATTGEDITDRMNDPSVGPGEGILRVAGALGRLIAAQQIEAERQLLEVARAGLQAQPEETPLLRTPKRGDELILNGVTYRYDGSSGDGDHFTRMEGQKWKEVLVSLRQGSPEARWVFQQLSRQQ